MEQINLVQVFMRIAHSVVCLFLSNLVIYIIAVLMAINLVELKSTGIVNEELVSIVCLVMLTVIYLLRAQPM